MSYAAKATAADIAVDDLRIDPEGDLSLRTFLGLEPEGDAGFRTITARVHLSGDAPSEHLAELHESVIGASPVGHTLARTIPVEIHLG